MEQRVGRKHRTVIKITSLGSPWHNIRRNTRLHLSAVMTDADNRFFFKRLLKPYISFLSEKQTCPLYKSSIQFHRLYITHNTDSAFYTIHALCKDTTNGQIISSLPEYFCKNIQWKTTYIVYMHYWIQMSQYWKI